MVVKFLMVNRKNRNQLPMIRIPYAHECCSELAEFLSFHCPIPIRHPNNKCVVHTCIYIDCDAIARIAELK